MSVLAPTLNAMPFLQLVVGIALCLCWFSPPAVHSGWGYKPPPPDGGVGSDPHFAVRLPEGNLLCYTFQGLHNTTFNLISNDQLEMNALFVPDATAYDNTWLGSIGITVLHNGKNIYALKFIADDQLIRLGERVQLKAKTIKKLSFHNGELTMLEVPSNHTPKHPRVQVEFVDSNLNFTVRFTKNNHLDLFWHSTGVPYEDSKGVIGELFVFYAWYCIFCMCAVVSLLFPCTLRSVLQSWSGD